jgi:molecular chaperone HscA
MAADPHLLPEQERAQIEGLLADLIRERQGSDTALIEAASKALAQGTEAFAARRMNQGIARALTGRNIETL